MTQTHPQNNIHCSSCFQRGGSIMRFTLILQYKNSTHIWENDFPCFESLLQYLDAVRPFIQSYSYHNLKG